MITEKLLASNLTGKPLYWLYVVAFALCLQSPFSDAYSQSNNRLPQRKQVNNVSVMVSADHPDSTLMKIADDLSVALDSGDQKIRVVPVVGDGAQGNLRDVMLLRNIDIGLTDLVALKKLRESRDLSQAPWLELAHIATLFPDKIQIIASKRIGNIKQLDGAKVSVGIEGSGSALHGKQILDALGLSYTTLNLALPDSAEALLRGDIDAMICFCLSSPGIYKRLAFNLDIHILPIPFNPALHSDYLPATIVHKEFPYFVGKDEKIETVAVMLAMVTYNWKKENARYERVARFVKQFFNSMSRLRQSPRHRDWQRVKLGADAPGWQRFAPAQEWLDERQGQALTEMRVAFNEFLDQWAKPDTQVKETEQTQLFEEFLSWRANVR